MTLSRFNLEINKAHSVSMRERFKGDRDANSMLLNWVSTLTIAGFGIYMAWPSLFGANSETFLHTFDDAFYYLKVAYNIAHGYGSTFDRINLTNGYQPLWIGFIIPIYGVIEDRYLALRLVNILQIAIVSVSVLIIFRTVKANLSLYAAALIIPLFFWRRFTVLYIGGVESALVILALSILCWFLTTQRLFDDPDPPKASWFKTGLLFGILLTARLDYICFLAAFYLCLWTRTLFDEQLSWRTKVVRMLRSLQALLAVLAIILAYFSLNFSEFGHVLPISAALKSSFPFPSATPGYWNLSFVYLEYLVIVVLCGVFMLVSTARPNGPSLNRRNPLHSSTVWLSVGTILHYGAITLFQEWGLYLWYFAGYIVTFAVIASVGIAWAAGVLGRATSGARLATSWLSLALLLFTVVLSHWYNFQRAGQQHTATAADYDYEASLWMDRHLPSDSVVAMVDAGVTGYFSNLRVVNLDGLANSYDYQEYLRRGDLLGYLDRIGARYIIRAYNHDILATNYSCFRYDIEGYLYKVTGGQIVLCKDHETFRSHPATFDDGRTDQLIIWSIQE